MNWTILASALIFTLNLCPSVIGQTYDYSNGNTRVINQTSHGLAYPSGSYIGTGTMSKSAQQGAGIIVPANSGLPKVNRGRYIGTPGDNLYGNNPDIVPQPKQFVIHQARKPAIEQPKEEPNAYVRNPDIPLTYGELQSDSSNQTEKNNLPADSNAVKANDNQPLPIKHRNY